MTLPVFKYEPCTWFYQPWSMSRAVLWFGLASGETTLGYEYFPVLISGTDVCTGWHGLHLQWSPSSSSSAHVTAAHVAFYLASVSGIASTTRAFLVC